MKVIIINDIIINFNNVLSIRRYSSDSLAFYLISNIPTPNVISTTSSDLLYGKFISTIKNDRSPDIIFNFERSIGEEYKRIKDFLKNKDETVLELNIKLSTSPADREKYF